mgnify:CR=1 FL=1
MVRSPGSRCGLYVSGWPNVHLAGSEEPYRRLFASFASFPEENSKDRPPAFRASISGRDGADGGGDTGGIDRPIDDTYATFNAFMNRNAETTSKGFAAITSAIAGLDTRLAVLAQKFESMGKSVESGRRN